MDRLFTTVSLQADIMGYWLHLEADTSAVCPECVPGAVVSIRCSTSLFQLHGSPRFFPGHQTSPVSTAPRLSAWSRAAPLDFFITQSTVSTPDIINTNAVTSSWSQRLMSLVSHPQRQLQSLFQSVCLCGCQIAIISHWPLLDLSRLVGGDLT